MADKIPTAIVNITATGARVHARVKRGDKTTELRSIFPPRLAEAAPAEEPFIDFPPPLPKVSKNR